MGRIRPSTSPMMSTSGFEVVKAAQEVQLPFANADG